MTLADPYGSDLDAEQEAYMHCYECAKRGVLDAAAVALCRGCSAALCLRHVREEAAFRGPGGTRIGCAHDTWHVPAATAVAEAPAYGAAPAAV